MGFGGKATNQKPTHGTTEEHMGNGASRWDKVWEGITVSRQISSGKNSGHVKRCSCREESAEPRREPVWREARHYSPRERVSGREGPGSSSCATSCSLIVCLIACACRSAPDLIRSIQNCCEKAPGSEARSQEEGELARAQLEEANTNR